MTDHILNIDDIEYQAWQHGDRFEAKLSAVSSRIGAKKLGYNVMVLAPGPETAHQLINTSESDEMNIWLLPRVSRRRLPSTRILKKWVFWQNFLPKMVENQR